MEKSQSLSKFRGKNIAISKMKISVNIIVLFCAVFVTLITKAASSPIPSPYVPVNTYRKEALRSRFALEKRQSK